MVDQVWEKRWKALDDQMEAMESCFLGWESAGVSRIGELRLLLKCLRRFAAGQFRFFYHGFETSPPSTLHPSFPLRELPDYPVEYVLHGVISQISHDVHVIQRAANQRIMASGLPQMQTALDTAEQLAWDALQPAMPKLNAEREVVESGLLEKDTTVLVYFEKLQSIRIIPYAPVALIAVNFTTMNTPQDYLAIPHEVGHYVFWRGQRAGANKTLGQELSTKTGHASWTEEIFADVYGCMVAGPVMALDFQDMQLEKRPKDFIDDDGKHPTPILRPHIYAHALGTYSSDWAEALEGLWNLCKKARSDDDFACNEAIGITSFVLNSLSRVGWDSAGWWAQNRNPGHETLEVNSKIEIGDVSAAREQAGTALYVKYDGYFLDGAAKKFEDPESSQDLEDPPPLTKECVIEEELDKLLEKHLQILEVVPPAPDQNHDWWIKVALAKGWTTHGNSRWLYG